MFEGFEFSSADIFKQEEQTALRGETRATLINIVLLCTNHTELKQVLADIWPNTVQNEIESPEMRKMDLFLAKVRN